MAPIGEVSRFIWKTNSIQSQEDTITIARPSHSCVTKYRRLETNFITLSFPGH